MNINFNKQSGFTIIELLAVLTIVAILATMAVPSYRSYISNNRQQQAKSDMLKMQGELEKWRSRTLTYAGFAPKSGFTTPADSMIKSPIKSDNKRYELRVYGATAVLIAPIKTIPIASKWIMTAVPIDATTGLKSYLLTSNGIRCSTPKKADLTGGLATRLTDRNCGPQSGVWK